MPLILDPSIERARANPAIKPDYINGVRLALTQAQLDEVIFVKYENTNPFRSDLQRGAEWEEEFCADTSTNPDRPRLLVKTSDGEQRFREDHGLIIRVYGTPVGIFALTDNGMVPDEQAEALEEVQNKQFARFKKWEFRLKYVLKTDGPERRLRLQMANEQRKEEEKGEMFAAIKEAFKAMAQGNQPAGALPPGKNGDPFAGMEIEQIAAILEMKKAEQEDKERQEQERLEELTAPTPVPITVASPGMGTPQSASMPPDSLTKGQPLIARKR